MVEAASAEEALMALQTAPVDVLVTTSTCQELPDASSHEKSTRVAAGCHRHIRDRRSRRRGERDRLCSSAKPYNATALASAIRFGRSNELSPPRRPTKWQDKLRSSRRGVSIRTRSQTDERVLQTQCLMSSLLRSRASYVERPNGSGTICSLKILPGASRLRKL